MSDVSAGVSIVICTYNGKSKLGATLAHIAAQRGVENILIEVLVIDNGSTDGTREFAKQTWEMLNSEIPLQVIEETRPGKTNASKTGFSASRYNLIILCDDDNWLCEDYVNKAFHIMSANSLVGVLGGRGIAQFESVEPEWFARHMRLFAVGQQSLTQGDVTESIDFFYGAGMVFRKQAWNNLLKIKYSFFLNYEPGGAGNWGGEDIELFEMIRMMGYRVWYDDSLTFKHFMPTGRITYEYLKNKFYGVGRIRLYTRAFLYCAKHNEVPSKHFKYPLWLDRWQYQMRQYIKQWPRYLFQSQTQVSDEYLKFIALKGELHELMLLKENYNRIFEKTLAVKKQLTAVRI